MNDLTASPRLCREAIERVMATDNSLQTRIVRFVAVWSWRVFAAFSCAGTAKPDSARERVTR
jgi:hypothetical protein